MNRKGSMTLIIYLLKYILSKYENKQTFHFNLYWSLVFAESGFCVSPLWWILDIYQYMYIFAIMFHF